MIPEDNSVAPLFRIPACAADWTNRHEEGIPAGGFGSGTFTLDGSGAFRRWRIAPPGGVGEQDAVVPGNRFHVFQQQGNRTSAATLGMDGDSGPESPFNNGAQVVPVRRQALFPFTWTRYEHPDWPAILESCSFSPTIPYRYRETSLPLWIHTWRAHNPTSEPVTVALMLTWEFAHPTTESGVEFDLHHDRKCISGILRVPGRDDRFCVAVPDVGSVPRAEEQIEGWRRDVDGKSLWSDFAADGMLRPTVRTQPPAALAAVIHFSLAPGEIREFPFVVAWHFPVYHFADGREVRRYPPFIDKRVPDNIVVDLASEAMARYRDWKEMLQEWQAAFIQQTLGGMEDISALLNALGYFGSANTVWTEDNRFTVLPDDGKGLQSSARRKAAFACLARFWSDLSKRLIV